jgi:hypothetical protein
MKLKCIGWVNVYKDHIDGIIYSRKRAAMADMCTRAYLRTVRVYVVRGKGKKK